MLDGFLNSAETEITEPLILEEGLPYSLELYRAKKLAAVLLRDVMQFRRVVNSKASCDIATCQACLAPHLHKVVSAILLKKPVSFVLPAFPGKSPNLAKVLSPLPDRGEREALKFLNSLCLRVKKLYEPGAQIILCSDGRVFSDVVGMKEDDVTAYQSKLREMIEALELTHISTYSLDDLTNAEDFTKARVDLMERHGKPLELLREKVRKGGLASAESQDAESHRMYCGITRFLVEDSTDGNTKSRTAIQKDCRVRAYQVILRSNAWSELIAEHFPQAVRLSIHPQTCGALKLGIQLLGTESWMTPWHGVAVDTGNTFVLMKRWEAEKLGAELVHDSKGVPTHFKLGELHGLQY